MISNYTKAKDWFHSQIIDSARHSTCYSIYKINYLQSSMLRYQSLLFMYACRYEVMVKAVMVESHNGKYKALKMKWHVDKLLVAKDCNGQVNE